MFKQARRPEGWFSMKNDFIKSIIGGFLISIGCLIYAKMGGGVLPAVLFSFGLISILMFGFSLYTGAVGYIVEKRNFLNILIIFVGNIVGCAPFSLLYNDFSRELFNQKIEQNLGIVFFKAFICGVIIYLCVEASKSKKNLWYSLLGVPAFILSGAEHSIADVAYMLIGRCVSLRGIIFLLVVAIGNAAGSIVLNYFSRALFKS